MRRITVVMAGFLVSVATCIRVEAQEETEIVPESGTFVLGSMGRAGFDFESGRLVDREEADLVITNSAGGATGLSIDGVNGATLSQPMVDGRDRLGSAPHRDRAAIEAWKRARFEELLTPPRRGFKTRISTDDRRGETEILVIRTREGMAKMFIRRDFEGHQFSRAIFERQAHDLSIPVVFVYCYSRDPVTRFEARPRAGHFEPRWVEPILADIGPAVR